MIVTNSWKSEFTYDGKMRRRITREYIWRNSAWVQTSEVREIYDGMLKIQDRNANNVPLVTYTRGNDLSGSLQGAGGIGGLLARTDHSSLTPYRCFYHSDGNGNVTMLIDENENPVGTYAYDSFGNTLAKSGPLADAHTCRFSSKEIHASSGLYYYGYRFYEPNLPRWLYRDPIGVLGGLNLHRFVANDPANRIDPWGSGQQQLALTDTG